MPTTIPPSATPAVRFGARRLDDGRLPVYFQVTAARPGGYVPAQVWQLQPRDYPRLSKVLRWWDAQAGQGIFSAEDLGYRALSLPLLGPVLLNVKKAKDGLLNIVWKNRIDDEDDQFNPVADATAIADYAMTVDGRTLALLRMTRQNAGSLSYYSKHYDELAFEPGRPVYEIEMLQSAFWNRGRKDRREFQGNFDDVTRTLMSRAIAELPDDADVIYTPASKPVDWLFKSLLASFKVPYEQYYSGELYGRRELSPQDFENDYPDFYRMKASDLKPAMHQLARQLAEVPFDERAMTDAREALKAVDEPVRLVRSARFEPEPAGRTDQ